MEDPRKELGLWRETLIILQICETISLKGMGVKSADQVTLNTSRVSKTKDQKEMHIYTELYLIKLFSTEVQVNSDTTINV